MLDKRLPNRSISVSLIRRHIQQITPCSLRSASRLSLSTTSVPYLYDITESITIVLLDSMLMMSYQEFIIYIGRYIYYELLVLLYREINNEANAICHQNDLLILENWANSYMANEVKPI